MKNNNHFVAARTFISRITVLAICAGFITACNETKPDVVVVTPTTVASPTPTPIAPTPVPTTTATVAPTTTVSPTPPGTTTTTTRTVTTEPITDVVVISSAPEPQTLVGRRVQFTGTQVLSVIGDRPFWVGRSNNEQLVVVLDPALDKGSAEDKIKIKAGQNLNLTGVLKPMPSAATAQKQWGITAAEAQGLQTKGVYLQADKINQL